MCLGRIKKFVCDKLSVFGGGENTNVGKINCPGMKMSAWSLSDATLQSKLKGRKRTFREKGISRFISEKEKEGCSTISQIYIYVREGISFLDMFGNIGKMLQR